MQASSTCRSCKVCAHNGISLPNSSDMLLVMGQKIMTLHGISVKHVFEDCSYHGVLIQEVVSLRTALLCKHLKAIRLVMIVKFTTQLIHTC